MSCRPLLLAGSAFVIGCAASIMPLYEEAKSKALADPGPAPAKWQPDVVMHLNAPMIQNTVKLLLEEHGTVGEKIEIMGAKATPTFSVNALNVASSDKCMECLMLSFDLDGKLAYNIPGLGKDKAPIKAKGAFDVQVELTENEKGVWTATLKPRDLRNLKVDVGGEKAKIAGLAEGPVKKWIDKNLIAKIPPAKVAKFGSPKGLPLRGVRVMKASQGLRIGMLTTSSTYAPLKVSDPASDTDWQVDISQGSLAGLAAAASFNEGPLDYDIVVEPTKIGFGADTFDIGVKVWRVKGKGWWREYLVKGDIGLQNGKIKLKATEVEKVDASEGLDVLKVLEAVAGGKILSVMEENIKFALPSAHATKVAGMKTKFGLVKLAGSDGALKVGGSFDISKVEQPAAPPDAKAGKAGKGRKAGKGGKAKRR